MDNINRRLRIKILDQFYTQANFAQVLGIDDSLVSKVLQNRKKLSPEKKEQWAKKLSCDVAEIFD